MFHTTAPIIAMSGVYFFAFLRCLSANSPVIYATIVEGIVRDDINRFAPCVKHKAEDEQHPDCVLCVGRYNTLSVQ